MPEAQKRVLIVTYYFPPSGGPAVQRILRLLSVLPGLNWTPTILTVKNGDYPVRDASLLDKIPTGVDVRRTTILEPYRYYRKLTKRREGEALDLSAAALDGSGSKSIRERFALFLRSWLFIPDPRIIWLPFAVREGLRILRGKKIDLIFSSGPPNTVHLVALLLKRLTGKPWVADFRDPWFKYLMPRRSGWLPQKVDEALCRQVVKGADHLVWVCDGVRREMDLAARGLFAGKDTVITNGYNQADFDGLVPEKSEQFVVTYVGSFFGRYDLDAFIEAVERLMTDEEDFKRDFKLVFCGAVDASIAAKLRASTFSENVEFLGYQDHKTTLTKMVSATLLLLYIIDSFEGRNIPTSKLFEYLGARRTVLALAPEDSDAGRILRQTGAGVIVPPNDRDEILQALAILYGQWQRGELSAAPGHANEVEEYEILHLGRRLVNRWERIAGERTRSARSPQKSKSES